MTVPDRYCPFMTVPERFMSVFDRFIGAFDRFMTSFCVNGRFLPLIFIIRIPIERLKQVTNDRKRPGTVRNAQERSETLRNGQKRSGTVRNGERSGTVNGLKRSFSSRSRSETFTKSRSRSRSKNERNAVKNFLLGTLFFLNFNC
jgi:hypothetical protein